MFDRHAARNDYQAVGTEASAWGIYLVAETFLQIRKHTGIRAHKWEKEVKEGLPLPILLGRQ